LSNQHHGTGISCQSNSVQIYEASAESSAEQRLIKITDEQANSIDINNIDIPTVMRRMIQQQQNRKLPFYAGGW